MKPTSLRLLLTLGVVSTALGWAVADLVDGLFGRSVPVQWTGAATLTILALALAFWAVGLRRRLNSNHPVNPFVAARTAALAMAASRTGSVAAGVYAGFLVWFAGLWQLQVARERFFAALAAVVAGLLVVGAALWLERICRIPSDDEDGTDGETGSSDASADWVHPRSR